MFPPIVAGDVCANCGWLKEHHDADGEINKYPVQCYGFVPTETA